MFVHILYLFVFHIIGLYDFGKAFLCTLCSLVPFLERELVDTLPYVVASTLTTFSASLVENVVDVLCWQLLPFTGKFANVYTSNAFVPRDD